MAPLLVRPPLRKIPKPEIWPVLLRGLLLLSKVPPARDMRPALMGNPWVKSSLLFVEAASDPALVELGLVRIRVPPNASMVPAVLLIALLTLPKPWMVSLLAIVPPARVAANPPNLITPPFVKALEILCVPSLTRSLPLGV